MLEDTLVRDNEDIRLLRDGKSEEFNKKRRRNRLISRTPICAGLISAESIWAERISAMPIYVPVISARPILRALNSRFHRKDRPCCVIPTQAGIQAYDTRWSFV